MTGAGGHRRIACAQRQRRGPRSALASALRVAGTGWACARSAVRRVLVVSLFSFICLLLSETSTTAVRTSRRPSCWLQLGLGMLGLGCGGPGVCGWPRDCLDSPDGWNGKHPSWPTDPLESHARPLSTCWQARLSSAGISGPPDLWPSDDPLPAPTSPRAGVGARGRRPAGSIWRRSL